MCSVRGRCVPMRRSPLIKYTRLPLLQHVYPAPSPWDMQLRPGISLCDGGLRASGCALHLASGTLPLPFHSFQVKCLMRGWGVGKGDSLEMQIKGPRLRAYGNQGITWSTTSHTVQSCGVSDSCVDGGGAAPGRH